MRRAAQKLVLRQSLPRAAAAAAAAAAGVHSARRTSSTAAKDTAATAAVAEHPDWDDLPDHGPVSELYDVTARTHGLCDASELCYGAAQAYTAMGHLFAQQMLAEAMPEHMQEAAASVCTARYVQALTLQAAHVSLRSLAAPDDRVAHVRLQSVRVRMEGEKAAEKEAKADVAKEEAGQAEVAKEAEVAPEQREAVKAAERGVVVELDVLTVCRNERLSTDVEQFSWFLARMDPDDDSSVMERRNTSLLYQHSGSFQVMQLLAWLRRNYKEPLLLSPQAVPMRTLGLSMTALDTPVKTTKRIRLALCVAPDGKSAQWMVDDISLDHDLVWPSDVAEPGDDK